MMTTIRPTLLLLLCFVASLSCNALDPTATNYTMNQCCGSLMPYPTTDVSIVLPDSLKPVFINHIGRHGARFPASPNAAVNLSRALAHSDSLGYLTPTGRQLQKIVTLVIEQSHNRWGGLDSLGLAEQRGIASRMFRNFPGLFNDGTINAISSYSPRCVMSMYEFTHQLDRLNNHNEITTRAGRNNSALLRPFDVDKEYVNWRKSNAWQPPYIEYINQTLTSEPLTRLLGKQYPLDENWQSLLLDAYHVVAGLAAMGIDIDEEQFFTREEFNQLWSCFNLKQYLQRSATTVSSIPAEITSRLLIDLIQTCDDAVAGQNSTTVCLRFGHAETLIPLLAQLHITGGYYLTNYFDTVGLHWRDFDLVPMAANLQFVISCSAKGKYYLSTFLNERPVALLPNDARTTIPYTEARAYMQHCLPLHLQF